MRWFCVPFLRSLGYKSGSLNLGLPESIYFKNEDDLRSVRRLHQEYLRESGWVESKNANQAVRSGHYPPWTSYAFTHWFESRNVSDLSILEFGSGASTLYWANAFKTVDSIESDSEWLSREKGTVVDNTKIHLHSLTGNSYRVDLNEQNWNTLKEIFDDDKSYFPEVTHNFEDVDVLNLTRLISKADWIFIDGGPRNFYTKLVLTCAKPGVVFVLDNTDEAYTLPARTALLKANFVEIPFHSLGPLNPYSWTTSIFISSLEVLK